MKWEKPDIELTALAFVLFSVVFRAEKKGAKGYMNVCFPTTLHIWHSKCYYPNYTSDHQIRASAFPFVIRRTENVMTQRGEETVTVSIDHQQKRTKEEEDWMENRRNGMRANNKQLHLWARLTFAGSDRLSETHCIPLNPHAGCKLQHEFVFICELCSPSETHCADHTAVTDLHNPSF